MHIAHLRRGLDWAATALFDWSELTYSRGALRPRVFMRGNENTTTTTTKKSPDYRMVVYAL